MLNTYAIWLLYFNKIYISYYIWNYGLWLLLPKTKKDVCHSSLFSFAISAFAENPIGTWCLEFCRYYCCYFFDLLVFAGKTHLIPIYTNMKIVLILILNLIQLPCIIEGWISYFLNCIVKMLSNIIFLLAVVSFIWWPLDMLCGLLWAGCECLKQKILSRTIKFSDALILYTHLFPAI